MTASDVRSVLERSELSLTARVLALGQLVNSSGCAYSLGEGLGLSRSAVREALDELGARKFVVEGRAGSVERPSRSLGSCEAERMEAELASTRRALMVSWSEAWLARFGPAPPAQLARVQELAPWLIAYARRRVESPEELASSLVVAFFTAKGAGRYRPRVEWLAEDPGRYLDPDMALLERERGLRSRARHVDRRREREAHEHAARERGRAQAESYQRERYGSGPVPVGSVLLELLRAEGADR